MPDHLWPILLVFVLAGTIKGVVGLGLPTVAMGLLGLAMPPAQAAALLLVPSLVTNIWQLCAGPRVGGLLRRLWPMLLGVCAGTWAGTTPLGAALGAGGLTGGDARRATAWLGVALLLYALSSLFRLQLAVPVPAQRWAGPLAGLATGVMTGATGVFAVPAVPYLGALGLARDELVQALGLSFTVSTLALGGALALHGGLQVQSAGLSLLVLVPALLGMVLGGWLRRRIRPEAFRRAFLLGLLVLGGELLWRGLAAAG